MRYVVEFDPYNNNVSNSGKKTLSNNGKISPNMGDGEKSL